VIDHGDQSVWSLLLRTCASFREKSLEGIMQPLGQRRKKPLVLERYLLLEVEMEVDDEILEQPQRVCEINMI
jgi:hypothetical protein